MSAVGEWYQGRDVTMRCVCVVFLFLSFARPSVMNQCQEMKIDYRSNNIRQTVDGVNYPLGFDTTHSVSVIEYKLKYMITDVTFIGLTINLKGYKRMTVSVLDRSGIVQESFDVPPNDYEWTFYESSSTNVPLNNTPGYSLQVELEADPNDYWLNVFFRYLTICYKSGPGLNIIGPIEVNFQETLVLTCTTVDFSLQPLRWFHNRNSIKEIRPGTDRWRYRTTITTTTSPHNVTACVLQIQYSSIGDAGLYMCFGNQTMQARSVRVMYDRCNEDNDSIFVPGKGCLVAGYKSSCKDGVSISEWKDQLVASDLIHVITQRQRYLVWKFGDINLRLKNDDRNFLWKSFKRDKSKRLSFTAWYEHGKECPCCSSDITKYCISAMQHCFNQYSIYIIFEYPPTHKYYSCAQMK